eukprot:CAMPEP_0174367406 /NCGR_PEP_ID=MMETSP0811_2-20130205/85149_1 /TAXON_ID=73025 ORGANISM="Eutreptiella gymnastica-like, Strain CCMP1594" /NCGR_SAMPLE_ID=MMETSP0811_2 /ASSEMBLY_ACC=CAM_ASM_000667 /LENGTH=80 /DNA_ID=CAMNT_0015509939 /DNA_START=334 /DNA_END=576 /DNA_ORIENTATION=-
MTCVAAAMAKSHNCTIKTIEQEHPCAPMDHPHWVRWADSGAYYHQPTASVHILLSASTSVAEPLSAASALFLHPHAATGS